MKHPVCRHIKYIINIRVIQTKIFGEQESKPVFQMLLGDHESQVSEGGEADLHTYMSGCKKNPGHTQFIPIDTFSLKHLPEGHQDNDLYNLIKAAADLTVRVAVKMTSPDRPKFWPSTKVQYPFYQLRDKTNLRTGSGKVSRGVYKFTHGYSDEGCTYLPTAQTCWCKHCKLFDKPNNIWWEFDVVTASHVVFDDTEANQTSLTFFYDSEKCPALAVNQVRVRHVNVEDDWCVLRCVTCDHRLGERLCKLWQIFLDLWKNAYTKFKSGRDMDRLSFIISHPHGCPKQVSVGHWVDKYKDGDYLNRFTNTTSTCPGSSGAPVHFVGYQGWMWLYQLVHSGSLYCGLNYSGSGWAL